MCGVLDIGDVSLPAYFTVIRRRSFTGHCEAHSAEAISVVLEY